MMLVFKAGRSCFPQVTLAVLWLLLAWAAALERAMADEGILAYGGPHAEALRSFIAEAAEPAEITIAAGSSLDEVLRKHCGHVVKDMYPLVARHNPGAASPTKQPSAKLTAAQTVKLPACLYLQYGPIAHTLREADTLETVASLRMGHAGPRSIENIRTETINKLGKMPKLAAGATIWLPYVSRPTRLMPSARYTMDAFIAELSRLNDALHTLNDRVVFVMAARFAESMQEERDNECKDNGPGYPLSLSELRRVIALNDWYRAKVMAKAYPKSGVVVLVLDDGVQGSERAERDKAGTFPNGLPHNFAHWYEHSSGAATFGHRLDTHSPNRIEGSTNDRPIPHDPRLQHGTHVTGILHGGIYAPELKDILQNSFNIRFAHINVVSAGSNREPWIYHAPHLNVAIREVQNIMRDEYQKVIINVSAGASGELGHLGTSFLNDRRGALLVASAGNHRKDLSRRTNNANFIFPAQDGGYGTPWIVTVAASQGDQTLVPRSNYGHRTVDLAAPGCRIGSIGGDPTPALTMSGTSQAAPFVSLTAAMLAGSGLPLDDVKRRLWKSVNITGKDIAKKLASHGVLNMPRALAFAFDAVTLKNGTTLYGALEPQVLATCNDEEFDADALQRLDFDIDAKGAACAAGSDRRCVRMVELFDTPASRLKLDQFREPRWCRAPANYWQDKPLRMVALSWDPATGAVTAKREERPMADVASVVFSETRLKGEVSYREALLKAVAGQVGPRP